MRRSAFGLTHGPVLELGARAVACACFASVAWLLGCRSGESATTGASLEHTSRFASSSAAQDRVATTAAFTISKSAASVPTVERAKADLGRVAPNFRLQDLHGNDVELASFRGKIVVLEWFSPTSQHSVYAWSTQGPLRALTARASAQGLVWLTISSPGVAQGSTDLALHRRFALENRMRNPLLVDADGIVARAYGAKAAPHMFVINEKGVLVYRGALDNAPRGYADPDTGLLNYVEEAIKDMRAGNAVLISETPPHG